MSLQYERSTQVSRIWQDKRQTENIMQEQHIECNPKVMMGKPVVSGTRLTVELILEKLAAGETMEQLLIDHPRLTQSGVRAAIMFAADKLRTGPS